MQSDVWLFMILHTFSGLQVVSLQGVRSMQAAFEAFLDILKCQMDNHELLGLPGRHAEEAASYIESVASQLLALGECLIMGPRINECIGSCGCVNISLEDVSSRAWFLSTQMQNLAEQCQ